MKVIIVTQEPFPIGMAAVSRIKCYAKGLIAAGVPCEVIICRRTEKYGINPKNVEGDGIVEGVPFKYIGGSPLRKPNILNRIFDDWKDAKHTCNYIKKNTKKGDVVLCYMREDPFAKKIIIASHQTGAKCIRDLCEYPYITRRQEKNIDHKRKHYLNKVLPLYDGLIVISRALYDLALDNHIEEAKLIKIPIMVNINIVFPRGEDVSHPYLFHSGTLSEQKDGILGAIEAFAIASKQLPFPVYYYLTGNIEKSPDFEGIKKIIRDYKIEERVKFLGYLSDEELRRAQGGCTAMIINKHDNQQNRYCFATKIGEYMLSGKPVIVTNVGEAKYYIKNNHNGFIVNDGDIKGMSDKIVELFNNIEKCNDLGENGRKTALSEFDYMNQGQRLKLFLQTLVNM